MLSIALNGEGYEVQTAANGAEALAKLAQWRPHVILLDLMMPVMDGPTFLAERRRLEAVADIPVIVLSAWSKVVNVEGLGAAEVLTKPCDLDRLLETIERLSPTTPC